MKRAIVWSFVMLPLIALAAACVGENQTVGQAGALKDGVYEASTAPDSEQYYCRGVMKVEGGKIVSLQWEIRDKNRNDRLFDETYGPAVFTGNDLYQTQCRENLRGMKKYGPRLLETQDVGGVDAVSGATWAHSQFYSIMRELLKKARG